MHVSSSVANLLPAANISVKNARRCEIGDSIPQDIRFISSDGLHLVCVLRKRALIRLELPANNPQNL